MNEGKPSTVRDVFWRLSEGFSTQHKVAIRYWIALAIGSIFTVMLTPKNGQLTIPFVSIAVSPEDFYPFVFVLLSVLEIGYGSANCQAIRTRRLIQKFIENSCVKFVADGDIHLQDLLDSVASPAII